MNRKIVIIALLMNAVGAAHNVRSQNRYNDDTPGSDCFKKVNLTSIETLSKAYRITDFGVVADSTILQTEKIQAVIDQAHQGGGGVIIIPKGTFLSGSLFFKPKTHLHLEEGGVLKGSD